MSGSTDLLAELAAEVEAVIEVEDAALTFINGAAARQQAAIEAALANGATAEQLAPIQAEVDAMKAKSEALAAAIVANTPAE